MGSWGWEVETWKTTGRDYYDSDLIIIERLEVYKYTNTMTKR